MSKIKEIHSNLDEDMNIQETATFITNQRGAELIKALGDLALKNAGNANLNIVLECYDGLNVVDNINDLIGRKSGIGKDEDPKP